MLDVDDDVMLDVDGLADDLELVEGELVVESELVESELVPTGDEVDGLKADSDEDRPKLDTLLDGTDEERNDRDGADVEVFEKLEDVTLGTEPPTQHASVTT